MNALGMPAMPNAYQRLRALSLDDGALGHELFVSEFRGKDLYEPLLDDYVGAMPETFMKLRQQLHAKSYQESRFLCHQLKGSLGTYGYPELSRIFAWMDEWLEGVKEDAADFDRQIPPVERLLKALAAQAAFHAAARRRARLGSGPHWAMGV